MSCVGHDAAGAASAAQDSDYVASATHDSVPSASAAQRPVGHESAAKCSTEQLPTELYTRRRSSVRQTGNCLAGSTSTQPVLVDTQQVPVLQNNPKAQNQDRHLEEQCPQQQEGPVIPLGELSQQLHESQGALATQQGQPALVTAAVASGQETKVICFVPAGSDGDKENVCQCVAAVPVTT